jgi:hypothetical protein
MKRVGTNVVIFTKGCSVDICKLAVIDKMQRCCSAFKLTAPKFDVPLFASNGHMPMWVGGSHFSKSLGGISSGNMMMAKGYTVWVTSVKQDLKADAGLTRNKTTMVER